jgi:Fibronectin type III domain
MHANERRAVRALWAVLFIFIGQFSLVASASGTDAPSNELVHGRGDATAASFPVPGFLSWGVVGIESAPESGGYWVVDTRGLVRNYNGAPFYGDTRFQSLSSPLVGLAGDSKGTGYRLLGKDGAVYAFGAASFLGAATALGGEAVDITDNGVGNGYWIALADGRVSHHGAAPDLPDAFGTAPGRIVGIAPTGTNAGYWLLAENGEVLPFGDAADFGDGIGAAPSLSAIAARPDGDGYWLLGRNGTIVSRGAASSFDAVSSPYPSVGAVSTNSGGGLWVTTAGTYDPGAIQGVVKNKAGQPLAGICVRTQGPAWDNPVLTSVTGFYRLGNLFPGGYNVQFDDCTNQHYYRQFYGDAADDAASPDVVVQPGKTTFKVNAAMGPGGFISGAVRDDAGNPPGFACVVANDPDTAWRDYGQVSVTGAYKIGPVKPGGYRVEFSDCGHNDVLRQTWPGADFTTLGQSVGVTAGGHVKNIGGVLRTPGEITGVVTDVNGAPLSGVCVNAGPPGGINRSGESNSFAGATTSVTGFYRLRYLRTDAYAVHFADCSGKGVAEEWYHDGLTEAESDLVNVVNGQTTANVNESMAPGASISGTVNDGNPCATVRAWRNGEVITGSDTQPPIASAATSITGFYRIAGLRAGSYQVSFTPCSPTKQTEWYMESPTRAGSTVIELLPGQQATNIFVDTGGGASISGVVRGPNGDVRAGACVQAKDPASGLTWNASTSVTGFYRINGLSAQGYKVRFDPCGSGPGAPEWFNNKANEAPANLVNVTGGDTPNINAQFDAAASITGVVTGTGGRKTTSCIDVFDVGGNLVRQAHSGPTGFYRVDGLHGGQYKVRAFDCEPWIQAAEWWNDKPDLASADALGVAAGKSARADFELAFAVADAPTNVSAQALGPSVNVTWTPPAYLGTTPTMHYEVTAWRGGLPVKTVTAGAGEGNGIVNGLEPGVQYRFRVAARNGDGLGRQSLLSNAATPGTG